MRVHYCHTLGARKSLLLLKLFCDVFDYVRFLPSNFESAIPCFAPSGLNQIVRYAPGFRIIDQISDGLKIVFLLLEDADWITSTSPGNDCAWSVSVRHLSNEESFDILADPTFPDHTATVRFESARRLARANGNLFQRKTLPYGHKCVRSLVTGRFRTILRLCVIGECFHQSIVLARVYVI